MESLLKLGRKGRVAIATAAFLLATVPAALFGMAYADGWASTTTATAQGGKVGQPVARTGPTPTAKASPTARRTQTPSPKSKPSPAKASPSPSTASPTPARTASPSPTGVEIVIG